VSKLVVNMSVTLDGVAQAPGRADEDSRGGFAHGGWAVRYFDPAMFSAPEEGAMPALLFGRRTYEDFYSVWPKRTGNPFTGILNASRKYVASRALAEPLPWENSTLLEGDAEREVAALKERSDRDLLVLGSVSLVQSLLRANLVDEWALSIHPLVLGSGRRLFPEGSPPTALRLVETKTSSTGVVIATYRPAAEAPQGG
jgi:dihydrofolate reductase